MSVPLPPIDPLRAQLEALLLVSEEPIGAEELARVLGVTAAKVVEQLGELSQELDARGSGIDLREEENGWRFYTRKSYAPAVEKLLFSGTTSKLSRAALETLAVIAYRQPVTRGQVSSVRGVNVDGVMRTLQLRGLIQEVIPDEQEEAATGARFYGTTQLFLDTLGLHSLQELPELAPMLPQIDSIDAAEF